MKKLISILLTVLFSLFLLQPAFAISDQLYNGKSPIISNSKLSAGTQEIDYSEYALLFSNITRTPLWSAEHLTKERVIGAYNISREDTFHPDDNLLSVDRSELEDYQSSGYDRGHMSPNKDFDNVSSQYECFSLANMIPQDHNNNTGIWSEIESATRSLAIKEGELYIITGPIFIGDTIQQINGRIMVPTHIYKAIYDPKTNQAAAYLTENKPGANYQIISIAQLEEMTGINLFPDLSPDVKANAMTLPVPKKTHHSQQESSNNSNLKEYKSFFGMLKKVL